MTSPEDLWGFSGSQLYLQTHRTQDTWDTLHTQEKGTQSWCFIPLNIAWLHRRPEGRQQNHKTQVMCENNREGGRVSTSQTWKCTQAPGNLCKDRLWLADPRFNLPSHPRFCISKAPRRCWCCWRGRLSSLSWQARYRNLEGNITIRVQMPLLCMDLQGSNMLSWRKASIVELISILV